jgi:hypothetical protein
MTPEQMIVDLQAKLGSDHPFVLGFAYELQKEGAPEWMAKIVGLIRKPAQEAAKTPLQSGLAKMKARLSAVKPQISAKTPMPHEEGSFPLLGSEARTVARFDARRNRLATPA